MLKHVDAEGNLSESGIFRMVNGGSKAETQRRPALQPSQISTARPDRTERASCRRPRSVGS